MKKTKSILLFITFLLCSCASQESMFSGGSEKDAEVAAMDFFSSHPEYTSSKEKEELLYSLFKENIQLPENRNKGMYQLLNVSHSQLQYLSNFSKNQ